MRIHAVSSNIMTTVCSNMNRLQLFCSRKENLANKNGYSLFKHEHERRAYSPYSNMNECIFFVQSPRVLPGKNEYIQFVLTLTITCHTVCSNMNEYIYIIQMYYVQRRGAGLKKRIQHLYKHEKLHVQKKRVR